MIIFKILLIIIFAGAGLTLLTGGILCGDLKTAVWLPVYLIAFACFMLGFLIGAR